MRRITSVLVLAATLVVTASAGPALADSDYHQGYPSKPSGYAQIVKVFGKPCSADAHKNVTYWVASDDRKTYAVWYHRKLGPSASTNIPDIRYHMRNAGYDAKVKRGIWGYSCRYVRGTTTWSTHAWGIGIDFNSAYESPGTSCHTISSGFATIWKTHNWTWGADFADCMHFQYASNY